MPSMAITVGSAWLSSWSKRSLMLAIGFFGTQEVPIFPEGVPLAHQVERGRT
jgi:hypothetical protein